MQNLIKEISNYLEKNNSEVMEDYKYNSLISDDLTLYNKKVIAKYKDKMLIERNNILQNYAEKTKENGEMFYIYDISTNEKNSYNLCSCEKGKSHEVITKKIEELPKSTELGTVIRKTGNEFALDLETTKIVGKEINLMIKEKIEEQNEYLKSIRIDGHTYEVSEKYSGRIWLYDLNNIKNGGAEGIEEIDFPEDLYRNAREGDVFVYKNGKYQEHI